MAGVVQSAVKTSYTSLPITSTFLSPLQGCIFVHLWSSCATKTWIHQLRHQACCQSDCNLSTFDLNRPNSAVVKHPLMALFKPCSDLDRSLWFLSLILNVHKKQTPTSPLKRSMLSSVLRQGERDSDSKVVRSSFGWQDSQVRRSAKASQILKHTVFC